MKEVEGQVGGRMERENNKRNILMVGAIMVFERNLVIEKHSGIYRNDHS